MNKIIRRLVSIVTLALVFSLSFSSKAYAYSDRMDYFDFEQTVIKMDVGTVRELGIMSYYDYAYYLGPHTSAGTYLECTCHSGTERVRLHIGADETVKNVFFHFYVDDPKIESDDVHAGIEVYVQKIDPEAAAAKELGTDKASIEALKTFSGNNSEFNALCYYYNYKDLRIAFGADPEKLLDHYNTYGKNENRIANRLR